MNNGSATFYGNGVLKFWQNSVIYNYPSATINIVGSLVASQNDQLGYLAEIQNDGTFQVSDGASAQLESNFRNRGNGVLMVSGQLSITSGFFTQEDHSVCNLALGGSLELANTGLFLGGTLKGEGYETSAIY
jgi:hypothetical protein